jgi:hypothetical protein
MFRKTKKSQKPKNRKAGNSRQRQDPALFLRGEYPGQPVLSTVIDSEPFTYSTTVTTGLIADSQIVGTNLLNNFATRFQSWNECRVVKCEAELMMFDSTNPGVISFWYEDAGDTSVPVNTDAFNAKALRFSAADVTKTHRLRYTPHDPLEQQWSQVSAGSVAAGTWKLYTDNGNYGSSVAVKLYLSIVFKLTVQFRGFV